MLREVLIGAAAGAIGTVALNAVTYGDMVVRGRPLSGVPSHVAGQLVERVAWISPPKTKTQTVSRHRTV